MWFRRYRRKQDDGAEQSPSLNKAEMPSRPAPAVACGVSAPWERNDGYRDPRGEERELAALRSQLAWSLRAVEHRALEDDVFRGPSWKSVHKWLLNVDRYMRQGLPRSEILHIRDYLEDRAPARENRIANAKARGVVHRLEFMDKATERHALNLGPGQLPNAWFEYVRNELLIVTPHGWVNPKSVMTWRVGIFVFAIAGTSYHESAVRRGCFLPGRPLMLRREPDNEFDANAVAVYAEGARTKAGYVPKLRAKRVSKRLDDGRDLVAVSARGDDAGQLDLVPYVIVCERRMFDHLARTIR